MGIGLLATAGVLVVLGIIKCLSWLTDWRDARAAVKGFQDERRIRELATRGMRAVVSGGGISTIPPQEKPPTPRDLTELDVARWLASHNSADTLSANRIYEMVRGNRNEVLRVVRDVRGAEPPQAVTPIAGRPYDPALYHQDDPGLRYADPPA